jgi:ATP-binding cassette subfamily B protein
VSGSTRLLARCFRKEWRALGLSMLATVLTTLATLAAPVPLALVVERVVEKSRGGTDGFELTNADYRLLAFVAGMVLGIALIQGVVTYVSEVSLATASERIVHELRLRTHQHLQRLSLLFHARRHTGDLVTRVTGDVNAVGSLFSESLATVFSAALLLTGMLIVSVIIDPMLALVAFAVTPLLALASFQARRKLKDASRVARAREGEIASLTAESFAAIREVKAFGSEPYEHRRLRSKSEERLSAGYDLARIQGRFSRVVDVIGSVGTAAVLVVGVFRVSSGALGPGELVVMVSYASRVYRPLRDIARQVGRIARSMARAERITEILAADDVLEERPGAYDGPPARGELELESVSFSYEADRPALSNASLRIEAGTKLALVGRSGAGKSTVAALIARFYDPSSGRVLVDGRDVRDCSLAWLRRQVGLVLQDTVLFSGTVADNIAYGLEVGQDEIEAAAKVADAHGFISELPAGYDTELGPRGIGLSGGQRQRIAIARTLLRDPAILILDEPTTGLDAESEAEVLDGLSRLMRGRTTVLISHSPRLLERADRAVSIDAGRIVGEVPVSRAGDARGLARNLLRSVAERLLAPEAPPSVTSEPKPPPRPIPAPAEAALPRLPVLLDAAAMAPFLERSLGPDATVQDVRIRFLRYKPGTNIVVRYDVGLDGRTYSATAMIKSGKSLARRAAKPENVALARLVDGRSPAPMPLHHEPEIDALIQWFPLDLDLPTLAQPLGALLDELEAAGAEVEAVDEAATTLAYKPRRRAVLRVGEHVLKLYAEEVPFERAAAGLRVAGGVREVLTPELEGQLASRLVTMQPALVGSRPASASDVATKAGQLLAELHAASPALPAEHAATGLPAAEDSARLLAANLPALPGRVTAGPLLDGLGAGPEDGIPLAPPARQLQLATRSTELVTALLPHLTPRIETLLRELEETMPTVDRLVHSHGDFNARQLLLTADGVAVVDFDSICLAPPALDVAGFAAHEVRGTRAEIDEIGALLDAAVEGYGEYPLGLSWYLAASIVRRSPEPFRYVEDEWPERVEGMVRMAETVVGR